MLKQCSASSRKLKLICFVTLKSTVTESEWTRFHPEWILLKFSQICCLRVQIFHSLYFSWHQILISQQRNKCYRDPLTGNDINENKKNQTLHLSLTTVSLCSVRFYLRFCQAVFVALMHCTKWTNELHSDKKIISDYCTLLHIEPASLNASVNIVSTCITTYAYTSAGAHFRFGR